MPPHVLNGSLRQVLYDTLVFQGWDLYHAEFVLRQGPDVLMGLVAEMLNQTPSTVLRPNSDGDASLGGAVKYYVLRAPVPDGTPEDQAQALVLTETLLAFLLFLEGGQPNATFRVAFNLSVTMPYAAFRAGLRAALKDHPHVPWLGQELYRVFVEQAPPTRDALVALAQAFQERVIPLLPNVSPDAPAAPESFEPFPFVEPHDLDRLN